MNITTNHHWRNIEYDNEGTAGFTYKDEFYPLSDFERVTDKDLFPMVVDGVHNLTAFSGIAIRLSDDGEAVKIYYFWS